MRIYEKVLQDANNGKKVKQLDGDEVELMLELYN